MQAPVLSAHPDPYPGRLPAEPLSPGPCLPPPSPGVPPEGPPDATSVLPRAVSCLVRTPSSDADAIPMGAGPLAPAPSLQWAPTPGCSSPRSWLLWARPGLPLSCSCLSHRPHETQAQPVRHAWPHSCVPRGHLPSPSTEEPDPGSVAGLEPRTPFGSLGGSRAPGHHDPECVSHLCSPSDLWHTPHATCVLLTVGGHGCLSCLGWEALNQAGGALSRHLNAARPPPDTPSSPGRGRLAPRPTGVSWKDSP